MARAISKILLILGLYNFLAYLECFRSYAWSKGHSDPDLGSVSKWQPTKLSVPFMSKDVLGQVFQLRKYVGHCYREVKSISDPIWLPYRYGFTSGDLSSSSKFALKWKGVRKYIVHTYIL